MYKKGCLVFWVLLLLFCRDAFGQVGAESVPGEVIVGLEAHLMATAGQILAPALQRFGGEIVETIPELSAVLIKLPTGLEASFIARVSTMSEVRYAEQNYIYTLHGLPNDPKWEEWPAKLINVLDAWPVIKGDKGILVAVIDSGVDYNHEDLAGVVQKGYDFADEDEDPMDEHGHGTYVAGIIAAIMNNGKGIAGVAQVSILAVRVVDKRGNGGLWDIAQGIVFAVKKRARIINMSLGVYRRSELLYEACWYAAERNVLLVASAGNEGGGPVCYPAAFDTVIAVSAVDCEKEFAKFSSKGPEVELTAPGVKKFTQDELEGILSTVPGDKYAYAAGTSVAAPYVAGVAALVLSVNPRLSNYQVRAILGATASDLGSFGRDFWYGYGLVDAFKAVEAAKKTTTEFPAPSGPVTLSIKTDRASYRIGDVVTVTYSTSEAGTLSIFRIGSLPNPELLLNVQALPATDKIATSFPVNVIGVETLVLQFRASDGRVYSSACSYSVGDTRDLARISVDRGCDSRYSIGDLCTIILSAKQSGTATVFAFSSDGSVNKLFTIRLTSGETTSVKAKVTGPAGTELLVVRFVTDTGSVSTAYCRFLVQ